MDLASPPGTRIAAAAITLLFSLGVADQLKTPTLPAPATAATSVEEIADRLRRHLDDDATRAPYVTPPSAPLLAWCRPQGVATRTPPEGVPAYSGELLLPELEQPLRVRFWFTSPEAAAGAATAARRGTGECDRPGRDALQDVAGFDRLGWRGVRALVAMEAWDDGEPGAVATIVAARGGLLAEVTWAWPFDAGAGPGRQALLQGTAGTGARPPARLGRLMLLRRGRTVLQRRSQARPLHQRPVDRTDQDVRRTAPRAAALRTGRTALMRTLARLPAEG
ncbi:hypothetical protein AB0M50_30380 [Nonomuraea fuscirosea]|uniref:hypothetical protein n=1 Tax=Nonomuraea fuscirosea TaxID=1291556 RepID=UPI00342B42C4